MVCVSTTHGTINMKSVKPNHRRQQIPELVSFLDRFSKRVDTAKCKTPRTIETTTTVSVRVLLNPPSGPSSRCICVASPLFSPPNSPVCRSCVLSKGEMREDSEEMQIDQGEDVCADEAVGGCHD